jgi:two-component system cell cycle sensor histidine kinase/response regulator CckA
VRRLAEGLGRLRRPRGVLAALAALSDPGARHLFEGDGRARALVDRQGRLLRANPALAGLLGAGAAARATLDDLFAPEPAAAIQAALAGTGAAPTIASGIAPMFADSRHDDGSVVTLRLAMALVREPDGQVSGAVLTLEDARPSTEALASEVQARKLQAIGALAGGVAHDFNNLLQAIAGAAEALSEPPQTAPTGAAQASPPAAEEVAVIREASRRGAALVRQLLAFSRQQTLMPRVVAVNRAVSDLAPLLRRSLGERVRLQLVLEEPERAVRVDPGQLDQVLVNLAVNARDAMPDGGTLTLRTRRRTLLAPRRTATETIPPGRYVGIEVQDTGTGIPPDVLPRIFEPFFTTRPGGGTGLGLSTVVGIVRQSGGFLEVETAPGQGSLFRILLPRSGEPPAPSASASAPPGVPAPATTGIVLLVEDEDAVRRLAERALRRRGWQVLSADSAEAALALLTPGQRLACVVTDMVMPGMDGAALVVELRQRLAQPDLPAIIASGYAEVPRHDAIGTAATAFLPKPYALRDLTDRVAVLALGDPAVAPA